MDKNFEDLTFNFEDFNDYKDDIEEIKNIYDDLMQDRNVQKLLKKQLKNKQEKELKEEQEENYKQSEWLVKKQKKIEQLETNYKEANESVIWWQNRYNAVERDKKQLENNRDKAIEYVESHFIFNDKTGECYQTHTFDKDNVKKLYDILKGDSE